MRVYLAFDDGACLLTFLEGLSVIMHLSCQSRSVFNWFQAEHITSLAYFSEALAFNGCLNHSRHLTVNSLKRRSGISD